MDLSMIIPRKYYYHTNNLQFHYVREDKYMYLFDRDNLPFYYSTPMLKVFKSIYEFNNEYYLVLTLDDEDDINNDIYNFKSRMDRIYGKAQDEVKKNYKEIFPNLKGYIDQVTYETCIKRPYTGSRGQLMKILIPEENESLFKRLEEIIEGQHIKCNIMYKGLKKVSGGRMVEEYVLIDFITEDEWMSEVTKKMINPYGTKFNIEVIKENINDIHINHENTTENINDISIDNYKDIKENVNNNNEIDDLGNNNNGDSVGEFVNEVIIDNSNVGDRVEVESIVEIEDMTKKEKKKEKKEKREDNKRKKVKDKKKKNTEEWIKKKTGKYESGDEMEGEKDGLSDNEEFREMGEEEKEKFRKLYRKLNQGKK